MYRAVETDSGLDVRQQLAASFPFATLFCADTPVVVGATNDKHLVPFTPPYPSPACARDIGAAPLPPLPLPGSGTGTGTGASVPIPTKPAAPPAVPAPGTLRPGPVFSPPAHTLYEGAFVVLGAGVHGQVGAAAGASAGVTRCCVKPVPPCRACSMGGHSLLRPFSGGGGGGGGASPVLAPNHIYMYPAVRMTTTGTLLPANRQSTVLLHRDGTLSSAVLSTGSDTFRVWVARSSLQYVPIQHFGSMLSPTAAAGAGVDSGASANGPGPLGVQLPISQLGPSVRQKFDPDHPVDDFLQAPETSRWVVSVCRCGCVGVWLASLAVFGLGCAVYPLSEFQCGCVFVC